MERIKASREAWLSHAIEAALTPEERPALDTAIELLQRIADVDLRGRHPTPQERRRRAREDPRRGREPINDHIGDAMTESPSRIDPERAALLVMDYQPVVLGSLSDAEALLARIAEAIAVVRRHRGQVGLRPGRIRRRRRRRRARAQRVRAGLGDCWRGAAQRLPDDRDPRARGA